MPVSDLGIVIMSFVHLSMISIIPQNRLEGGRLETVPSKLPCLQTAIRTFIITITPFTGLFILLPVKKWQALKSNNDLVKASTDANGLMDLIR